MISLLPFVSRVVACVSQKFRATNQTRANFVLLAITFRSRNPIELPGNRLFVLHVVIADTPRELVTLLLLLLLRSCKFGRRSVASRELRAMNSRALITIEWPRETTPANQSGELSPLAAQGVPRVGQWVQQGDRKCARPLRSWVHLLGFALGHHNGGTWGRAGNCGDLENNDRSAPVVPSRTKLV